MWFKKKEKVVRKVYQVVIRFEDMTIRTFSTPWEEDTDWPLQYRELTDWFYYNTKREAFSFKYKKGVFIFKRKDVKTIEVTIEETLE